MNTYIGLMATTFLLLSLCACQCHLGQRETVSEHTLSWEGDIPHPQDTVFMLDAKAMGKGRVGYEAVSKAVRTWPKGTTLHISADYNTDDCRGTLWPDYPFRHHQLLYEASTFGMKIRIGDGPTIDWLSKVEKEADAIIDGKVSSVSAQERTMLVIVQSVKKGHIKVGETARILWTGDLEFDLPVNNANDALGRVYTLYLSVNGDYLILEWGLSH